MDFIAIKCINCKKETGLYLQNSTFERMITKFLLNAILYHMGVSWIISSNDEMKYGMAKNNNNLAKISNYVKQRTHAEETYSP